MEVKLSKNPLNIYHEGNQPSDGVQVSKNKNCIKRWKWKKRMEKKQFSRKERKQRKIERTNKNEDIAQSSTRLDESREKALNYLDKWMNDRENWKFRKLQQNWLINHAFDKIVPKDYFRIFVLYSEKLSGSGRSNLLERCTEITNQVNIRKSDDNDTSLPKDSDIDSVTDRFIRKRAKRLLKVLSKPLI